MDESHQNTSSSVKNNNRKRSRSRSRRKNNTSTASYTHSSTNSSNVKPKDNQKLKKKKNPSSSSFQQNNNNHRKRSRSRPKKKKAGATNNNNNDNDNPFPEQHHHLHQHQHQHQQKELLEQEERLESMIQPQDPTSNNVDDISNKSGQHQEGEESAILYLQWDSPSDPVPLHEEEAMVKMVLDRHGKSERGMLKDKPPYVITKFRKQLSQKAPTMTMSQLCSLRRHHIKRLNFYKRMPELRLGQEVDILKSAKIFEVVIETFLNNKQVEYWSEKEQGKMASSEDRPLVATPDFLLKRPVVLQKTRRKNDNHHTGNGQNRNRNRNHQHDHHGPGRNDTSNSNQQQQHQQHHRTTKQQQQQESVVLERQTIHWIEAKMFYGASTIPRGKKGGAVGTILDKAQKYVDMFGTGAIVFMMGCGQVLADQLREIGVTAVDCSSHEDFDLRPVHDHQRTWCANDKGEILP